MTFEEALILREVEDYIAHAQKEAKLMIALEQYDNISNEQYDLLMK